MQKKRLRGINHQNNNSIKCSAHGKRIKCKGFEEFRKNHDLSIVEFADAYATDREVLISPTSITTNEVIYGEDNRKEFFEYPRSYQKNARKAAAIINIDNIFSEDLIDPSGYYTTYRGVPLSECEPFFGQEEAAFATAVAINEFTCITADHVLINMDMDGENTIKKNYRIVYGFWKENEKDKPLRIKEIHSIKSIKRFPKFDLAMLKTQKSISTKYIADEYALGMPAKNSRTYCAGYPGTTAKKDKICLKIACDGKVKIRNHRKGTFQATLDVFNGNSGSPVFSQEDQSLLGIVLSAPILGFDHLSCGHRSCYLDEDDDTVWPEVLGIKKIKELIKI